MPKKIKYMSYCKDGDKKWFAVRREGKGGFRFYRKPTETSMQRFENLQGQSNQISFGFDLEEKHVEFHLSLSFLRSE